MRTCSEASKLLIVCERKDPLYKEKTYFVRKKKKNKNNVITSNTNYV